MALNLPGNTRQETAGAYTARMFNTLRDEGLRQRAQQLVNQYYGPNMESQIDYRGAQTNKLNTMTPLEAERLRLSNQYYGPNIESEINNRNALTEGYNIDNQYKPQRLDLQNQTSQEKLNQFKKTNPLEYEKLKLANEHQGLVNQLYPDLTRAQIENYKNSGGAGIKELNYISNQIRDENPTFTDQQVRDARNAYLSGTNTLPDGTPLPPVSGTMQALLNQSYKRGSDVAGRNQERFANTLETTFAQADKVAPNAFKFAGAAGKLKGGVSALKAQVSENSPQYRDYLIFTRQILPAMASEILRTGGANSTDSQKVMAISQANPIALDNNPQLAMEQYKFLKSLYRQIGKTVATGVQQTHTQLLNGNNNNDDRSMMIKMQGVDPKDGKMKIWNVPANKEKIYLQNKFKRVE